jgi:hypothetical protein
MTTNGDNTELARDMVVRQVTVDEAANPLQISNGSAYEIQNNGPGFHKVYVRWVPKQVIMLHKQMRLDMYKQYLDCHGNECDAFLESSLVMKHGTITASQRVNSRVWKRNIHNRPARKVQKTTIHRKTVAYSFWDSHGLILEHYQEMGKTINSAPYSEMLTDRPKSAIRSKSQDYC